MDKKPFRPLFASQASLASSEFHFSAFLHFYGTFPSVYTHFLQLSVGEEREQQQALKKWCSDQGLTIVARGSYSGLNEAGGEVVGMQPGPSPDVDAERLMADYADYQDLEWDETLHGELWRDENSPLLISTDFKQVVLYFKYGESASLIKSLIETFPAKKRKVTSASINFLIHNGNNFQLREVYLPEATLNLAQNYGTAFPAVDTKIQSILAQDQPGLVLLHGDPGTGKSYYIRYLLSSLRKEKRSVIYVPPFVANSICKPEFLPFMLSKDRPILVIEDAEQILISRETEAESAVSNVLNLTDGILAEAIRCQIIATFNVTKTKIDPALLRKGRLKVSHHFFPLSPQEANAKLAALNIPHTVTEPTTLADIYNFTQNTGYENNKLKQVGFA